MNHKKLLLIIIVFLILIAIPVTIFVLRQQTSTNSHAASNIPPQTQPFSSGHTFNVLTSSGWKQNYVSQNASGDIQITTPPGINWYYVYNFSPAYTETANFSVNFVINAYNAAQPTNQKNGYIHLMNRPVPQTAADTPDELVVGIDHNNKLLLYVLNAASTAPAQTNLVQASDNIVVPNSHHLIVEVSGIDTGQETVAVLNGDTKAQLVVKQLPSTLFATHSLYLKASIENEPQEDGGAILEINQLQLTTQ